MTLNMEISETPKLKLNFLGLRTIWTTLQNGAFHLIAYRVVLLVKDRDAD